MCVYIMWGPGKDWDPQSQTELIKRTNISIVNGSKYLNAFNINLKNKIFWSWNIIQIITSRYFVYS